MYKRPISRFFELYNPTTHNLQIWLAVLAFILFIFTLIFDIRNGVLFLMDNRIIEFIVFWWVVASIFILLSVFSFCSLLWVFFSSFRKRECIPADISEISIDVLVSKVKNLEELADKVNNAMEIIKNNNDVE